MAKGKYYTPEFKEQAVKMVADPDTGPWTARPSSPRFPPAPGPCLMSPGTTSCSPATVNNSDGPGPSAADPGSRYIPYAPDNGTWHDAAEDQSWLGFPGPRRRDGR